MSIRPVSNKLPSSEAVWDELNLPLCVVVTPFESVRMQQAKTAASTDEHDNDSVSGFDSSFALPISAVPKCLTCGAPHPTSKTHYRPSRLATKILCYFCGATSSVLITDQQDVRENEYLDPATYDKHPTPAVSTNDDVNDDDDDDSDYDPDDDDNTKPLKTDCLEFRVPVEVKRLPQEDDTDDSDSDSDSDSESDSDSDSDDGGRKRKKKKKKKRKKKPKKKQKGKNRRRGGDDSDDEDESPYTSKVQNIWQYPAVVCPPVWWIIIDGSVGGGRVRGKNGTSINSSQSSSGAVRNYWATIGTTLQRTLEEIPPHVHVGVLTATGSRLASWDLTSAVPSVKQYPYSYDPALTMAAEDHDGSNSTDGTDPDGAGCWDLSLVPANSLHKANLESSIRAMVDGGMSRVFADDTIDDGDINHEEDKDEEDASSGSSGIPLGLTIEIILDFMEQAHHPGQNSDDDGDAAADDGEKDQEQQMNRLRYAGGKILCLLGNPPLETAPPSDDSLSYVNQKQFYQGGLAGSCFDVTEFEKQSQKEEQHRKNDDSYGDKKKKKKKDSKKDGKKKKKKKKPESDDEEEEDMEDALDLTDFTSSNLQDYTMALDPDDLFVKIGRRCALAALGVDLFVLVPQENDSKNDDEQHIPWYGLPLLRPLSDCSGAPGPLMFGTANADNDDDNDDKEDEEKVAEHTSRDNKALLFENLIARTPWQTRMAFGAQLRLRLPPGFRFETTPIEVDLGMPELQMAPFLSNRGLTGPASSIIDPASTGSDDDVEGLWCMGTCDPHTSFTFDLEVDVDDGEDVPKSCEMEDVGDVALKPVMQACTLFTCIETDGAEPTPNYYTVCKMRVTSVSLSLAHEPEAILDGLDPEVLSYVLYQKIALDAYLSGFLDAQRTAEGWIQSFMVCLYESALQKQAALEADTDTDTDTDDDGEEREEATVEPKRGLFTFFSRKKLPASDDSTSSSSSSSDDDESSSESSDDEDKDEKEEEDDEEVEEEEKKEETEEHNEEKEDDEEEKEDDDSITNFVAGNRLLDEDGGKLDDEEILMGGGHFKAGIVPLLVYSIMQSDGLRPSSDKVYQPSMDARLCAIAQMGSMTPKALAKSIAPSLSLWSIKDDEPIIETLPLSLDGISNAIKELGDLLDEEDGVLLLESPLQISLFRVSDLKNINAKDEDGDAADTDEKQLESIEIGSELEFAILAGLNGFRTSPWHKLHNSDGAGGVVNLDDIQVFLSFLLEDNPTATGDNDFNEWKSKIANLVREIVDVDDEPDDQPTPRGLRRFLPFGRK